MTLPARAFAIATLKKSNGLKTVEVDSQDCDTRSEIDKTLDVSKDFRATDVRDSCAIFTASQTSLALMKLDSNSFVYFMQFEPPYSNVG